jgi:hypothetical protein
MSAFEFSTTQRTEQLPTTNDHISAPKAIQIRTSGTFSVASAVCIQRVLCMDAPTTGTTLRKMATKSASVTAK